MDRAATDPGTGRAATLARLRTRIADLERWAGRTRAAGTVGDESASLLSSPVGGVIAYEESSPLPRAGEGSGVRGLCALTAGVVVADFRFPSPGAARHPLPQAGEGSPAVHRIGDKKPSAPLWPGAAAPSGLLHEIRTDDWRAGPAAIGFALALGERLKAAHGGMLVFLEPAHEAAREGAVSARGLCAFGIDPARALFIRPRKEEDLLWAAEEAARAKDVAAAFLLMRADARRLTLTATRRLNLAAGKSGATPVIVRLPAHGAPNALTSAPMRWRVAPAPSGRALFDARAPGAARWRVRVEKSANAAHVAPSDEIHLVEWRHDERRFFLQRPEEAAHPRALFPASAGELSSPPDGRERARAARAL